MRRIPARRPIRHQKLVSKSNFLNTKKNAVANALEEKGSSTINRNDDLLQMR